MRIWLVEMGEILPVDDGARIMRTGLLARQLSDAGHAVTWWADAFNHHRKTFRTPANATVKLAPNFTLELLHGPAYLKNISLARLRHQQAVADQFRKLAPTQPAPEAIYCGYPTIELAFEVVQFARERQIPILVDVRDPWPHLFLGCLPTGLRWLGRIPLYPYFKKGRAVLRGATVLTATSEVFLDWALRYANLERRSNDEVFYLAYDQPESLTEQRVDLGPANRPVQLRCLFVGGFGPAYDLSTVVEAARLLEKNGGAAVQFVIAGDGPQAAALHAQAAGLHSVLFPGWVSTNQLQYLLKQSDVGLVAVTPLAGTSVPNKAFEYMSGKLVLLNTTTGDLTALIETEEIGFNYPPGRPVELAGRIQRLLEQPEAMQRMKRRAHELFLRRFEARKVYREMADKLVKLGSHSPAGGCCFPSPLEGEGRVRGLPK